MMHRLKFLSLNKAILRNNKEPWLDTEPQKSPVRITPHRAFER
jgi:hypothetical protein